MNQILLFLAPLPIFSLAFCPWVLAQSIIPAHDGTNTVVNSVGNQLNIRGGQLSGDKTNLFHSFTKFNLDAGQIANFQSNPTIKNILGRISSSNPSIINGLIQVTGGNSNLFLINPGGIVFGANGSLNVPASFTATTANGIGFGSNWFNTNGVNNYQILNGNPNGFIFNSLNPGSIINTGNLTVKSGQNLNLIGGTIISTGNLSAPEGEVNITSVPGENIFRISEPNHILSLDVQISSAKTEGVSLPQLLTGGNSSHATGVTVNAQGEVVLSGSGLQIINGDVVVKNLSTQTANLFAAHNLTLPESQIFTTGDLNLLANNTVTIRDSVTEPFLAKAGGNLLIQGNNSIDILALNHPETPLQSGGDFSLVSNGIISGDAHFSSGGNFSITNLNGQPGQFESKYDPIISSDGFIAFGDYVGSSLKIEARGQIIGGNITITSPDSSISTNDPDVIKYALNTQPGLVIRAGRTTLDNPPTGSKDELGGTNFTENPLSGNTISVGKIYIPDGGGPIVMTAPGNIEILAINNNPSQLIAITGNHITITNGINNPDSLPPPAPPKIIDPGPGIAPDTTQSPTPSPSPTPTPSPSPSPSSQNSQSQSQGNQSQGSQSQGSQSQGNQSQGSQSQGSQSQGSQSQGNQSQGSQSQGSQSQGSQSQGSQSQGSQSQGSQSQGNQSQGNQSQGNQSQGNQSQGNQSQGNQSQGNQSQGNQSQGNQSQSNQSQGNQSQGNQSQGNQSQGNQSQGNQSQGNQSQGNQSQGNQSQGNQSQGNQSQGNQSQFQGNQPQGNQSQGNQSQGNQPQGNQSQGNQFQSQGNQPQVNQSPSQVNQPQGNQSQSQVNQPQVNQFQGNQSQSQVNQPQVNQFQGNQSQSQVNQPQVNQSQFQGNQPQVNQFQGNQSQSQVNQPQGNQSQFQGNQPQGNQSQFQGNQPQGNQSQSQGNQPQGNQSQFQVNQPQVNQSQSQVNQPQVNQSQSQVNQPQVNQFQGNQSQSQVNQPQVNQFQGNQPQVNQSQSQVNQSQGNQSQFQGNQSQGNRSQPQSNQSKSLLLNSQSQSSHSDQPQSSHSDQPQSSQSDQPQSSHSDQPQSSQSDQSQSSHSDQPQSSQSGELSKSQSSQSQPVQSQSQPVQSQSQPVQSQSQPVQSQSQPVQSQQLSPSQTQLSHSQSENQTWQSSQVQSLQIPQTQILQIPSTQSLQIPQTQSLQIPSTQSLQPQPSAIAISSPSSTPTPTPTPTPTSSLGIVSNPVSSATFSNTSINSTIDISNPVKAIPQIESIRSQELGGLLGKNFSEVMTNKNIHDSLTNIYSQTGIKPALFYTIVLPDQLQLVLVTADGKSMVKSVPISDQILMPMIQRFRYEVTSPTRRNTTTYLASSQQLYKWLIAPIEKELQAQGIKLLLFSMDSGLRSLPIAALHDGKNFLIEKYSIGLIPSLSLTDTSYKDIRNSQVLAMGASEFKEQSPLPSVPAELSSILKNWSGKSFLNKDFTLEKLRNQRASGNFDIVHLATHGEFQPGVAKNSYIQFSDTRLTLDQIQQLQLNHPTTQLLVLSACRTALEDDRTELGFAGLSVQAGVKSVLASLWYVSDEGTLALMSEFYRQLKIVPIKSEALRQAQISMIQKKITIDSGVIRGEGGDVSLPSQLGNLEKSNLAHPYYWSGFTMIGSPW